MQLQDINSFLGVNQKKTHTWPHQKNDHEREHSQVLRRPDRLNPLTVPGCTAPYGLREWQIYVKVM